MITLTDEFIEDDIPEIDEKPEIDLTEWAEDIARAVLNLRWGIKNNIISLLDSGDVDPLDILAAAPALQARQEPKSKYAAGMTQEEKTCRLEHLERYPIDWERCKKQEARRKSIVQKKEATPTP